LNIISSMDEDLAAIKKILGGNVDAFELLLRKYSPKVFVMVGHKVPVEDVDVVAQDVFVSAFRSLRTYEARQPFENWLSRIVRRRCCDYWRDNERHNRITVDGMSDRHRQWVDYVVSEMAQDTLERECKKKEAVDIVHLALGHLNAEDKALIESVYFEDVSLKEVAVTFGWSVVGAKVRAHRARKKLRVIVENMVKNG